MAERNKEKLRYTLQIMSQDKVELVLENVGLGRVLVEIAIFPKRAYEGELVMLISKIEEDDTQDAGRR